MQAFTTHRGIVVPFNRRNIDTDAILPKQYLKMLEKTGFGDFLFDDERYLDPGDVEVAVSERRPAPTFILNQSPYDRASILLAQANFGCGSSREHAVWSLVNFGVRVVIAPSFGEIFYNNSINNALLPIILDQHIVDELFSYCQVAPEPVLIVDLQKQLIMSPDQQWPFLIEEGHRQALLNGLDEIGLTLNMADTIKKFEERRRSAEPWLFV
jgi:3-isopropylmalate/(R)-2-methylmalate dehydratase small subunit